MKCSPALASKMSSGLAKPRISIGKLGECLKGVDPSQLRGMPGKLQASSLHDSLQRFVRTLVIHQYTLVWHLGIWPELICHRNNFG